MRSTHYLKLIEDEVSLQKDIMNTHIKKYVALKSQRECVESYIDAISESGGNPDGATYPYILMELLAPNGIRFIHNGNPKYRESKNDIFPHFDINGNPFPDCA